MGTIRMEWKGDFFVVLLNHIFNCKDMFMCYNCLCGIVLHFESLHVLITVMSVDITCQ